MKATKASKKVMTSGDKYDKLMEMYDDAKQDFELIKEEISGLEIDKEKHTQEIKKLNAKAESSTDGDSIIEIQEKIREKQEKFKPTLWALKSIYNKKEKFENDLKILKERVEREIFRENQLREIKFIIDEFIPELERIITICRYFENESCALYEVNGHKAPGRVHKFDLTASRKFAEYFELPTHPFSYPSHEIYIKQLREKYHKLMLARNKALEDIS